MTGLPRIISFARLDVVRSAGFGHTGRIDRLKVDSLCSRQTRRMRVNSSGFEQADAGLCVSDGQ